MISRYDSKPGIVCPVCKEGWSKGDKIKKFDWKWGHQECNQKIEEGESKSFSELFKGSQQAKEKFPPTEYQARFYSSLSQPGNKIINAGAGCGKSHTLLGAASRLKYKKVLICCFNSKPANEVREKAKAMGLHHVDVRTLHSLGNQAIKKAFKIKKDPDKYKLRPIVRRIVPNSIKKWGVICGQIQKMISLHKNTLLKWNEIYYKFGIEIDLEDHSIEKISKWCDDALAENNADTSLIDFDDMIYFPHVFDLILPYYDHCMIDEAQDLNATQMELCFNLKRRGNNLIFVGDEDQAIYEWRGAESDSMAILQERFKCKTFELPESFRCPSVNVDHCLDLKLKKNFISKNDREGVIEDMTPAEFVREVKEDDLVLCRLNAPLLKYAFKLWKAGKPATILGKDIKSELEKIVEDLQARSIDDLFKKLGGYESEQCMKIDRRYKDNEDKAETFKELVRDRIDCIRCIAEECNKISDFSFKLNKIMGSSGEIILSTIHKAKGLEADRTFILAPEKVALNGSKQERNCQFVAYTRNKEAMYLVQEEKN